MIRNQGSKKAFKVLQPIGILSSILMLTMLVGCAARYNRIHDYKESLANRNYVQAAQRLERCAFFGKDMGKCRNLLDKLKGSGLPLADAIKTDSENAIKKARIDTQRKSNSPWDKLSLAMDIQSGEVEAVYPKEDIDLIEQAFFGFGECAKQTDSACMTQYARMILYGIDALPKERQQSAKEKALYWLKLAARYGEVDARRVLISLEEEIPSPDLSMENLQKTANDAAKYDMEAKREAERKMLAEARRANFISSMNAFFPKTVNCTTNRVGSYTYTRCN